MRTQRFITQCPVTCAAVLIFAETGTESLNTEAIAALRATTFKEVIDFLMPADFWEKYVKPYEKKVLQSLFFDVFHEALMTVYVLG